MRIAAPYHEGELLVQERTGEQLAGQRNSAAISDSIIKGALRFIEQQPMVVVGSMSGAGDVWASIVFGTPGFMRALDDRRVLIDTQHAGLDADDSLWTNIAHDPRVGLLVIELGSRRRLRINGRVTRVDSTQLRVDVDEAYPNCPKYIQRRQLVGRWDGEPVATSAARYGTVLSPDHRGLVSSADTLFVASANPRGSLDVSHRGGQPGFVQFVNDRTLRVPDYNGNGMFNTLGNFVAFAHAGLVVIDFDGGRVVQMIGRPAIQWDLDDPDDQTGGTRRYWDFEIERVVEMDVPFELAWEFLDYSPHNPHRVAG